MADASTPQFTYDDLVTINAAIAGGVLSVRIADREVTYSSKTEQLQARNLILEYLNGQNGTVQTRQVRMYGSKGWQD